ncbi:hypothetical protein LOK49_Contig92G00002 [Camellia lanceoleosa]|nr:hypothetical protein LOK49_Contig92G00002 [Camellia lanceoleosa]
MGFASVFMEDQTGFAERGERSRVDRAVKNGRRRRRSRGIRTRLGRTRRIRIAQPVFQHHRRKNNGNPNPSRKPAVRPKQEKNKLLASSRSTSLNDLTKRHNHNNYHHNNLVMCVCLLV